MANDEKTKDEKVRYEINKAAGYMRALSSSRIDKNKYLTGKEILPLQQHRIIEEAKYPCSSLKKAFETKSFKVFRFKVFRF